MADYVITTDSNSDVLPEFIKENNLTIIPQYYSFGDTVYGDELNRKKYTSYCIFQCIERKLQQCCHDSERASGGLSGAEDHGV